MSTDHTLKNTKLKHVQQSKLSDNSFLPGFQRTMPLNTVSLAIGEMVKVENSEDNFIGFFQDIVSETKSSPVLFR